MARFDMLGAREGFLNPRGDPSVPGSASWVSTAATIAGGAVGAVLWSRFPTTGKKHPVLGLLNGLALGGNVARVATREIAPRRAVENVGAHLVATASSLALPSHPAIGYLAGAVGANLFLRRRGDTYLERLDETAIGSVVPVGAAAADRALPVDVIATPAVRSAVDAAPGEQLTARVDYLSVYNDAGRADEDPVLVRKGIALIRAVGDARDGMVPVVLPDDAMIYSGHSKPGVNYPPHAPVDRAVVRWARAGDLTAVVSKDPSLIAVRVAKSARPAWQAVLAGIGVLVAAGGLIYGVAK